VSKASEDYIPVYRGGEGLTKTIINSDLVVGDVYKIEAGMRIPADSILVEGTDIATDESAMTGEPEQVEKTAVNEFNYQYNPNPFLIGNTLVESGQGIAIICAVGVNTRSGMAEEKLNIEEEITPLQAKLETIANEIGRAGVYVSILTFLAMTINLVVSISLDDNRVLASVETVNKLVDFIIIAITVIVVSVPEGLPLAVTISLAFSVMKMKKENNLVRKLDASETMGGANEICTDKTGTLTKN
jgi:magnesium-transporting ATPase (P-type)